MRMRTFKAWFQQPTTIGGLAAFASTASAVLMRQLSLAHAIPLLVGAITSMLLPDNTAAKAAAQTLAEDAVVALGKAPS